MKFPQIVQMDGRTYEVKAIHTLKTGERIARAVFRHSVLGEQEVHSPSVRIRLARRMEEIAHGTS